MSAVDDFARSSKSLFRRLRKLEERILTQEKIIADLRNALFAAWKYRVAKPWTPGLVGADLTDERVVCEVTAVVDADTVTVKRLSATAMNTWVDNTEDTATFNVGAPDHSLSVGDQVTVFWDGLNEGASPATAIYHVLAGGTAAAKIFIVNANAAADGVYDCHEPGGSGGGTNVTCWHESGLGLTGHRLTVGDEMLAFSYAGSWYGIDPYSWGKT